MYNFSKSAHLKGSYSNSFTSGGRYVYGKATTYGFESCSVDSLQEVATQALFYAISPYLYSDGRRSEKTCVGVGNVVILDVDSKDDISQALFKSVDSIGVQYCIIPTQNHLVIDQATNKPMYKYRVFIPISGITSLREYRDTIYWLVKNYNIPEVDSASYDVARFYAPTLPVVGQTFDRREGGKNITHSDSMIVTEELQLSLLNRLLLTSVDGKIDIPTDLYPSDYTRGILQYDQSYASYSPTVEDSISDSALIGTTLTELYDDDTNDLSSRQTSDLLERGLIPIGDITASLPRSGRAFVRCPTYQLHTDQQDERYAWVLKTGAGEERLYCASSHCREQHGDFRIIKLPPVEYFIADTNKGYTEDVLTRHFDNIINAYAYKVQPAIAKIDDCNFDTSYEMLQHAKNRLLDGTIIDINALKVYIMSISRVDKGKLSSKSVSTSGSLIFDADVTGAGVHMLADVWVPLIFMKGWNEIYQVLQEKEFVKTTVLMDIAKMVGADASWSNIVREIYLMKHSSPTRRKPMLDLANTGRVQIVETNSFDSALRVRMKMLSEEGIGADTRYAGVIQAFLHHWRLPYGAVEFRGAWINDLPTLLISYACMNLFSDGEGNQRHTTFVITAPPEIGKSSLIKNMNMAGLTNSDKFQADIFGYEGLYPTSIDELKFNLFTTGDELSPMLISGMSIPLLLGNLTRKEVDINVKRKIDSSFQSYMKVMWGARAMDALLSIPQSTELRSRLYTITYPDEFFDDSPFLDMCMEDDGYIDKAVQLALCSMYMGIKEQLLNGTLSQRVSAFHTMKSNIKKVYDGTIEYEEDMEVEAIPGKTRVVAKRALSDKDRAMKDYLKLYMRWVTATRNNPTAEGTAKSSILVTRTSTEAMLNMNMGVDKYIAMGEVYHLHKQQEGYIYLVIPTRTVGKNFIDTLRKVYGTERYYLPVMANKLLKMLLDNGAVEVDDRSIQYKDGLDKMDTRQMRLFKIPRDKLQNIIEED